MSKKVTQDLIEYVLQKLGVDNSLNLNKNYSIFDNKFLLKKNYYILDENNEKTSQKIWGVKYKFYDNKNEEIKFIISKIEKEIALIIELPEAYTYGLYYSEDSFNCKFSFIKENKWEECNMFLQFSMLSGLELCKNVFYVPYSLNEDEEEKINDITSVDTLISFIEYCDSLEAK